MLQQCDCAISAAHQHHLYDHSSESMPVCRTMHSVWQQRSAHGHTSEPQWSGSGRREIAERQHTRFCKQHEACNAVAAAWLCWLCRRLQHAQSHTLHPVAIAATQMKSWRMNNTDRQDSVAAHLLHHKDMTSALTALRLPFTCRAHIHNIQCTVHHQGSCQWCLHIVNNVCNLCSTAGTQRHTRLFVTSETLAALAWTRSAYTDSDPFV